MLSDRYHIPVSRGTCSQGVTSALVHTPDKFLISFCTGEDMVPGAQLPGSVEVQLCLFLIMNFASVSSPVTWGW